MSGSIRIAALCLVSLASLLLVVRLRSDKLKRAHALYARIAHRMQSLNVT
jgi:hypothetical protein